MVELPLWPGTHAGKPKKLRLIRIDLRRSLRMHRPLAFSAALAAAGLGAVYLYSIWSKSPAYAAPLIFKAGGLLLVSIGLGMGAAVGAQSLDERVYSAADVENVLGVAAMGEIPDFDEAANDAAEAGLMQLARGIDQACRAGSLRRCVLTGTGHGAGVSTLAVRVKELLARLNRAAMLVDDTGEPISGPGGSGAPHDSAQGSAGVESGNRSDELILTDASPLTSSPDTEYLARFADCVVVIVEAGVTSGAQLRSTAECLKQLNAAAVKFVVNRVKRAQSAQGARQPVSEQSVASEHFAAAIHRAIDDPPRPVAEPPVSSPSRKAPAERAAQEPKPSTALAIVKRSPDYGNWSAEGIPFWLSEALKKLEADAERVHGKSEVGRGSLPDAVPASAHRDATEPARPDGEPVTFERRSKGNASPREDTGAMLFAMELKPPENAGPFVPEFQETALPSEADIRADPSPSRLSGLRGMVSATGLKGLNQVRQGEDGAIGPQSGQGMDSAAPAALIEALDEAPVRLGGLRGLATHADLKGLNRQNETPPPPRPKAGQAEKAAAREAQEASPVQRPQAGRSDDSAPEPGDAKASVSKTNGAQTIAAKQEAAPKRQPAPARRGRRSDDEVQILPSKRGQYRRKKR